MVLIRCSFCDLEVTLHDAMLQRWREMAVSWAPDGTAWACRPCFENHP